MPECCSAAPHHLALQGASPQGEALEIEWSFLPKKWSLLNFFQARGRLGKMKKFESTSIVCLRRHFPRYRRFFRAFLSQEKKRKRGKQGGNGKLSYAFCLKNFNKNMLRPSSVAIRDSFPPGGKPWRRQGLPFLPKKWSSLNFFSGKRGSLI